jgi:hypothetical protein
VAWVLAKLAWNPAWKLRDLAMDFTTGCYGPAAPAMSLYNDLLQHEWEVYHTARGPESKFKFSKNFVPRALELVKRAEAAAVGQPEIRDLVEREEACVLYLRLENGPRSPQDEPAYRQDIVRMRTLVDKFKITCFSESGGGVEGKFLAWERLNRRPNLVAKRTITAPAIDGKLDDAVWKTASETAPWDTMSGIPTPYTTRGKVAWDGENLYVAVTCRELDGYHPKLEYKAYGNPVYRDDSIEVFVQANRVMPNDYYQIAVNSAGVVFDSSKLHAGWRSGIKAAGDVQADGSWTIELAIPLRAFGTDVPKPGGEWLLNLCRNSLHALGKDPGSRFINWSGPQGFHNPDIFGTLKFAE